MIVEPRGIEPLRTCLQGRTVPLYTTPCLVERMGIEPTTVDLQDQLAALGTCLPIGVPWGIEPLNSGHNRTCLPKLRHHIVCKAEFKLSLSRCL